MRLDSSHEACSYQEVEQTSEVRLEIMNESLCDLPLSLVNHDALTYPGDNRGGKLNDDLLVYN